MFSVFFTFYFYHYSTSNLVCSFLQLLTTAVFFNFEICIHLEVIYHFKIIFVKQ